MTDWRRDHKHFHIKPKTQNPDEPTERPISQDLYFVMRRREAWRFVEVVAVLLLVVIPLSVQAGFFTTFFTTAESTRADKAVIVRAIDTPLLSAVRNPNSVARGGADIVANGDVLVSTGPVAADDIAEQKDTTTGEIRVYTVREGDSLSRIAEMYDVTTNTIMWANDLNAASDIQPGDNLVILPIVGIRHTIKAGDTLAGIAKTYDGDVEEILAYNQLFDHDALSVGMTILVPGGALHTAPVKIAQSTKPVSVSGVTPAVAASVTGWLTHPAPGAVRTQGIHGYNAVDLAGAHGSTIRAAAAGTVIVAKGSGWNGGYGQYVVIKHNNGTQTLYAHLSSVAVGVGSYVSSGQYLGGMGSTGKSTGTHLHFEVRGAKNPF